ncbi:MAG: ABC transporter permease [Acidimicrobiia bacterium]
MSTQTAAGRVPARRDVLLIARREVQERVRQKSFVIGFAISLAIVLAIAIIPGLGGDPGARTYDVGVVGATADRVVTSLGDIQVPGTEIDARLVRSADEARALVGAGELDAALVEGTTVLVEEDLDDELGAILRLGVSGQAPPALAVEAVAPVDEAQNDREGLVRIGVLFLYMQLFAVGFGVSSGIVEEKSSRVVEVLLAKVSPARLLAGKILGIGLINVFQLLATVAIGLVAAVAVGTVDLPSGWVAAAAIVLVWFLLGFALYSCAFAVAGALASRVEELQNSSTPLTLAIVASFFASFVAAEDPGGAAATIATFLPPSAPLVAPIRFAADALPVWQLVAAVAVITLATLAMVKVAARVYTGGAMRTGKAVKLREAWSVQT